MTTLYDTAFTFIPNTHPPPARTSFKGGWGGGLFPRHPPTRSWCRALTHLSLRDAKNCIRGSAAAFPRPLSTVGATGVLPLEPSSHLLSLLPSVFSPPVARERKRNGGRETSFPLPPSPPSTPCSVPTVRTHARYTQGNSRRRQLRGNGI